MWTVFKLQWLRLKREPVLALTFLIMTILFVFFIGGSQGEQIVTVQTFSEELSQTEMEVWLDRLNKSDAFHFEQQDREEVEQQIQMSRITFALELNQEGYQYLVGQDSQFLMTVNQHVDKVYQTYLKINEVEKQFSHHSVVQQSYIELESQRLGEGVSNGEESSVHVLLGMTLYFGMYTVLFSLMNIAVEKRTGTWNRLISSPLKKRDIYIGQLLHYFLLGVLQIGICFLVFHQFFDYEFGGQYLGIAISVMVYVFAIVALGMLIVGMVQSPQQLQAVIPILSTGMAMLGGAFWPLEIVSNHILLGLAKLTPIHFGLDALKKAILLDAGVGSILEPISILLLMGILFMGMGLHLLERTK